MSPRIRLSVSGHYAGPVSRAAAALVDGGLIMALYTLGYAGLNLLLNALFGHSLSGDHSTPLAVASLAVWAFLYVFVSLAITGLTAGKGLTGLASSARTALRPRSAPCSFARSSSRSAPCSSESASC
jgi:RDD family